jgi:hypothetical protein
MPPVMMNCQKLEVSHKSIQKLTRSAHKKGGPHTELMEIWLHERNKKEKKFHTSK